MIRWEDVDVAESVEEWLPMLPASIPTVKKQRSYNRYVDVTATFDIETTNSETDGFPYSFQTCVSGAVIFPRYLEDWLDAIDKLITRYKVSGKRRLVLYVHNLGYEYQYLAQILADRWGLAGALYTKSRKPLYVRYGNGIELRDSLKLFQKSLARATEGLPHAKRGKEDMDYSIYRTPDTPLTYEETGYCVCDVLGLWEAIEKLKRERGYNQATLPMSNTGIVIDNVNKGIRNDRKCAHAMEQLMLDKEQMRIAYQCMAGGDTHGARWYAGQTLENCNSYDFKSAHPSQQLLWPFPAGKPMEMPADTEEDDLKLLIEGGYGWCGKLLITDFTVKPGNPDPTVSVSKCSAIEDRGETDNGRLLGAGGAFVWMDSNDYQRFVEGYDYDTIIMVEGFCFSLEPLPEAFRKVIKGYFVIKEGMKDSPDYMFSKICINTIFGACAQKTIRDEYSLEIGDIMEWSRKDWLTNLEEKTPEQVEKSQAMKFPFLWGLWTSSMSRLKLWRLLKIVGWDRCIYWDTDSCKFIGPKVPAVEEYNAEVMEQCRKMEAVIETAKGPVFIGIAEDEHKTVDYGYKRFRFLHAKCYAGEAWSDKAGCYRLESTIAGVGKSEGVRGLHGDINNLVDGLIISPAGGQLLTYHEAPIRERHDFSRPTKSASWIEMAEREYEVKWQDWQHERLFDVLA